MTAACQELAASSVAVTLPSSYWLVQTLCRRALVMSSLRSLLCLLIVPLWHVQCDTQHLHLMSMIHDYS